MEYCNSGADTFGFNKQVGLARGDYSILNHFIQCFWIFTIFRCYSTQHPKLNAKQIFEIRCVVL